MNKVIVTGASSFIGKAMTRAILEKYTSTIVYAIVRNKHLLAGLDKISSRLIIIECDYCDYYKLKELISGPIDVFIHFAWAGVVGSESRSIVTQSRNINAACCAMEQAHALQTKKFIFVGSSYQYRLEPYYVNGKEIFAYRNIYGMAKQAAADMLKVYAQNIELQYNSLLFTNVYGVGDCSNRSTNALIRQLLNGKTLKLILGEHKHDWTYIDDAVKGILAVIEKGKDSVEYYIGSRKLKTFAEIIQQVRDIVNPVVDLDFGAFMDKGYIDYSKIDLDRLHLDTGFECKSDFENNIRRTVDWIKRMDDITGVE